MKELEKFSEKLNKIKKEKNNKTIKYNNKPSFSYSIAINISIELITGIGLGVFCGIMLDKYLQTKPLMFIIFFILGTLVGFYNMYKTLKRYKYF